VVGFCSHVSFRALGLGYKNDAQLSLFLHNTFNNFVVPTFESEFY